MRQVDWYFDFISPYSYFALHELHRFSDVQVNYRPVLFAGLLHHWGHKGPAEIATKRVWTYRWCTWYAARRGISFRFPSAHPFNPLPYLRLAVAAHCELSAIRRIFEALWTTGADPSDPRVIHDLLKSLNIDEARLSDPNVKDALRAQTERAAAAGVFGVPTLVIDGEIFWGADAMDFARAYLADPTILSSEEMRRVLTLPVAASRGKS
jgi:2-hydroxychromene-2-carboxylate isomerase